MEQNESLEINSHMYGLLIVKEAKNTQKGKNSFFNKWYQKNWIITCRRMNLDPHLTPLTKINLKQIKDLNIRPKTINRHEFEQAPGIGDGQGRLACCSPWGCKEMDMTEQLNRLN